MAGATTLPEHVVILLVEDRPDDVVLVKRALAAAHVTNPLFVVSDGEEAFAYLDGVGLYADRLRFPLPQIMLLDLKMPKMDGFDVLRVVRNQPNFKGIRIIVLTSSEDIFDIQKAYELGASSFLVKPLDFEDYSSMMRTLSAFWLYTSRLPQVPASPPAPPTTSTPADSTSC